MPIKREDLIPGAKFIQDTSPTRSEVTVLYVGNSQVMIRLDNLVEITWDISSCLRFFSKIPPPKKKGTVKLFVYEIRGEVYHVTMSSGRPGLQREAKILAEFEVPWEEGQGIE